MNVKEIIEKRRAIFPAQYNSKTISKEILEDLLETANWAPSHKKTEPWRFKVMQGDALMRLGTFLANTYKTHTSPENYSEFKFNRLLINPTKAGAVIGICVQRDPKERVPEWEEIAATAIAVQNMWLRATELGLGGYWSSPLLIEHMDTFFQQKPGERCLGFFYLGYSSIPFKEGLRSPVTDKTTWMN